MKFEEKLKNNQYEQLWQEYCGFLDLDIDQYMKIQNRLMQEQIHLWSRSQLGKRLFRRKIDSADIHAFRGRMPLTTYSDYADVLLQKQDNLLPGPAVIWIQTTWEGGKHPVKVAPYTQEMLEVYKNNVMACFMLASSQGRGDYRMRPGNTMLYALAPLPYATGLLPLLLNEEITIDYLPPVAQAAEMTFQQRNIKGFEMGLKRGIDLLFGLSSVTNYIGENISAMTSKGQGGKLKKLFKLSPKYAFRYLRASYLCHKENRPLMPKDIFTLKGFLCAGTDSECYKDSLEEMWGRRPGEIAAGTEPTCVGAETWARDGMYFFPDSCFYEFIPEDEMLRSFDDKNYVPKTYLMDELTPNRNYELVVSVLKGGAFMRYRVGDVYRCLGVDKSQSPLPRFAYVDRVPIVIDIAGFTRITENSINAVIKLSGLQIEDWVAAKEYTSNRRPFLHLYVEMQESALVSSRVSQNILMEHLSIYFKNYDNDYKDLKKLLGIEPLVITVLKAGTFDSYKRYSKKKLRKINPPKSDMLELMKYHETDLYILEPVMKGARTGT